MKSEKRGLQCNHSGSEQGFKNSEKVSDMVYSRTQTVHSNFFILKKESELTFKI